MRRASLALLIGLGACGGADPSGAVVTKSALLRNEAPSTSNVAELGAGNRAFGFALYQQAALKEGNVLISPYSVSTALAMTYAGARTTTESEMKQALHFTLEQAPLHEAFDATDLALASRGAGQVGADGTPFRLNVDNSIWTQQGSLLQPAFLDTLAVDYGAAVYQVDFAKPEAARSTINDWVSDRTEHLIPELLPQQAITPSTQLVLTNTVYFNASWQTQFKPRDTSSQPFTRLDGSQVSAEMMHATYGVPYAEGADWQAVALPYASEELSLIAILPAAGKFRDVERSFDASKFDALVQALAPSSLQLGFPKLDYRFPIGLKTALMGLGMNVPFTGDADFSGIRGGLYIDDVIHQAVIRVTEGGTIAAAATAVLVNSLDAVLSGRSVAFDRPFLFAIYDQPTGTILFLGRVLDPTVN